MNDQKKLYRILKRDIKRDGNRQRRNYLKRALLDHPEEAHWDEFDFGQSSTKWLNGIDEENKREHYKPDDDEGGRDLPDGEGDEDHHPHSQ